MNKIGAITRVKYFHYGGEVYEGCNLSECKVPSLCTVALIRLNSANPKDVAKCL